MSKTVIANMPVEVWQKIPEEVRKEIGDFKVERNDFDELIKDDNFAVLYGEYRKARKRLDNYKYELRNK